MRPPGLASDAHRGQEIGVYRRHVHVVLERRDRGEHILDERLSRRPALAVSQQHADLELGHRDGSDRWKSWASVSAHEGFAGLAALFGQDHRGASRGVSAGSLDRRAVWDEVLRCADAINARDSGEK